MRAAWMTFTAAAALAAMTVPGLANDVRFTCEGGAQLVARFSPPGAQPGNVILRIVGDGELNLPQVMSADGGRYANGATQLWVKGRQASFTHDGRTVTCRTTD